MEKYAKEHHSSVKRWHIHTIHASIHPTKYISPQQADLLHNIEAANQRETMPRVPILPSLDIGTYRVIDANDETTLIKV
jgi:hypothetical protein